MLLLLGLLAAGGAGADEASSPSPSSVPTRTQVDATTPEVGKSKPAAQTRDNLDLDTTTITGNRELPKVMYVVPWKKADLGDLSGRPVNSLLDEVLAPVDRTVFRRQLSYFDEIDPDRPGPELPGAEAGPAH
ncbi:MAG: hypothetical protein AB7N70_31000 [Dehalococcoidia bacterium]